MSGKRSCQLKMPLQPSLCSSNSTVPVQRLALWCDISEITFKTSGHSTTETLWFGAEGETGIISVAEPNKLCFSGAKHLTLQVGTHEVEHYLFLAHFAIFKAKKSIWSDITLQIICWKISSWKKSRQLPEEEPTIWTSPLDIWRGRGNPFPVICESCLPLENSWGSPRSITEAFTNPETESCWCYFWKMLVAAVFRLLRSWWREAI